MHTVVRERQTPDGTQQLTVADSIIEDVRTAGYIEPACQHAGVGTSTVYGWLKIGAALSTAILAGKTTRSKLTRHERDCLEFSEAVDRARAEWVLYANVQLDRLARGGIEQRTVTTVEKRDGDGKLLERTTTTKTEHTLPDAATLRWRLERTLPHLYGRRVVVEGTGEDGKIPIEVRAAALVSTARKFISATAVEVDAAADAETGELLPEDEAESPIVEDRAVTLAETASQTREEQR